MFQCFFFFKFNWWILSLRSPTIFCDQQVWSNWFIVCFTPLYFVYGLFNTWKFVLNGLKYDIPSNVLQLLMHLKWLFERFVNQWCLINIQEMNCAHHTCEPSRIIWEPPGNGARLPHSWEWDRISRMWKKK